MNDKDQRHFSPFLAALLGGLAGAAVVYLSDEKRRKGLKRKFEELIDEGQDAGEELKGRFDDALNKGRKNLVKKLRQAEETIEKIRT